MSPILGEKAPLPVSGGEGEVMSPILGEEAPLPVSGRGRGRGPGKIHKSFVKIAYMVYSANACAVSPANIQRQAVCTTPEGGRIRISYPGTDTDAST